MAGGELCRLHTALGHAERCPGPTCAFWIVEPDRSGCVLEGVDPDLAGSPGLACYLLELRVALESARASDERTNARASFYRHLNEEQGAEA